MNMDHQTHKDGITPDSLEMEMAIIVLLSESSTQKIGRKKKPQVVGLIQLMMRWSYLHIECMGVRIDKSYVLM